MSAHECQGFWLPTLITLQQVSKPRVIAQLAARITAQNALELL